MWPSSGAIAPKSEASTTATSTTAVLDLVTTYCDVCEVNIMGPADGQNFLQHTGGKAHKKKAAAVAGAPAGSPSRIHSALSDATAPLSEWPPEAPFISLTPSGPARRDELHRILTFRLVSRDELASGRHAFGLSGAAPSPLTGVTDAQHFSHVVRTVLEHRPDVFVLQHVAGNGLREFTRAFSRQTLAKETYEFFPSSRLPEGTQPWTHHFLGYRRDKYKLVEQHVLQLHELVAARGRNDAFCEQSISTSFLSVDHAVAWILLLEDVQPCKSAVPHRMLLVSVELPHAPDLGLFRACCIREIQHQVAQIAADENISKSPPSVVVLGDFGEPPTEMSYAHFTTLTEPRLEQVPIRVRRDSIATSAWGPTQLLVGGGGGGDPPASVAVERNLRRCAAHFEVNAQYLGQHDCVSSMTIVVRDDLSQEPRSVNDAVLRHIHEIRIWDGTRSESFTLPSRSSRTAVSRISPSGWGHTTSRVGEVIWDEWHLPQVSSLADNNLWQEEAVAYLERAVQLHGLSFSPLAPLKEKPKRMRNCFRSRWDDAIPGLFRSAYSHYQQCCGVGDEQISRSNPDSVNVIVDQLSAVLAPHQLSSFVASAPIQNNNSDDDGFGRRLESEMGRKNPILSSILQRCKQQSQAASLVPSAPPGVALSSGSSSLVHASCYPLVEWLRSHRSSPLCASPPVVEPLFTSFLPMRCDALPGPVTPCRTTSNFTTHFDRRRWNDKFGGFEWGTYDFVMYLRDRMEVVKLARLPTFADIGPMGLPSSDLRFPSSHLPLCVEFWVPR